MNQFIIVCFENTFDGVLLKDRGNIVSTKQGHKGIGISIIKDVVEKYDGNASFKTENDRFIIEIVIPIV